MFRSTDWNLVWKEMRAGRTTTQRGAANWEKRSSSARTMIRSDVYARDFFRIMRPQPEWTILDMGCGPGTLALPLAPLVTHITAADFAQGMLDIVAEECTVRGIRNISIKKLSWEDDWLESGIGKYDVVIASRSLVTDDLREAITKLDSTARQKVFIVTIAGDGPYDRKVFEALGRPLNPGPDYICSFNVLYQMGIHARVDYIEQNGRGYESPEEAFGSMNWMVGDMTPEETTKLKAFIDQHLVFDQGRWMTDYERRTRWAVLWWDKSQSR
ncbi:class I SAM-dependent methyltransferase [Syntrophorhabdus aromaticivorans]|uniref:Class I SAM-dependent methyltransferase n=1 Tax=Syntrophorhabdus aromaticivorans TaxID=328301 RepID=A0A971M291_9BACT|nr:class I SAM-dependent methyltransferase [Syntrophorhabdus aromaticivorans]NLW34448.1 class I SAM-dependent methyltransferase [Syntrophorhabdus aromaticivorans]